MKKISPPSLQNAVRIWDPTPERICKNCIKLHDSQIPFSYQPINKLLLSKARFREETGALVHCIENKEKREWVLQSYVDILNLYGDEIDKLDPKFAVEIQGYPLKISRDLSIPVLSSILLGLDDTTVLPVPIFWSQNVLTNEQLRFLVTAIRAQMRRNPDIEDSRLQLWDFSKPSGEEIRRLRILEASSIQVFSDAEFHERLEILARGITLAQEVIDRREQKKSEDEMERPNIDFGSQASLFADDIN